MYRIYRPFILVLLLLICLALFAHTGRAQEPPIVFNEILVGNAATTLDTDYTNFSGWIELRNTTSKTINLSKYRLVSLPDGATMPDTFIIKSRLNLPANGRLILWADEKNKGPHLPFKLDMDGGELSLFNPAGNLVTSIVLGKQSPDVSYGRAPDNSDTWAYFDQPTPGAANTTPAFATRTITAAPQFSVAGGPHNGPLSVELGAPDAGAVIRYTTDGSRPTAASAVYGAPIAVNGTTIIRARAWMPGKMVSPTATQTYLINIPVNLPVISLVLDPPYLWSSSIGMYVKGSNGVKGCRGVANWHQSWERPGNIEFYEISGQNRINQEIGIELSGNCTRNFDQKSFELKARKLYGDNDMDYAFFAGDKPMTSYKRLVLRNGGNDNYHAFLRDAFAQTLAQGRMDVDRQAYRPAVVYLNGAYWGLYDMREKMDEDFVENNYNLDENQFDFLEKNYRVKNGSATAFRAFYTFIKSTNLTQPSAYAQVRQKMDVDEFINYLIVETFSANTDWGRNNVRYWDDYGDAYRWRWAMHDLDFAFFVKNANRDMLAFAFRGNSPMGFIASRLWTNADFRNEFAQRYAAHLNTTYTAARINGLLDSMAAGIRPEMGAQTARWGRPANAAAWEAEVQELRTVALQRVVNAREHLRKRMGNKPDAMLTINIDGDGRVLVAGAEVSDGYSGPHFRDVPITLTAVPDPGKLFDHWLETGETTPVIAIPFIGDTTRTAVFGEEPPPPPPPNLVINELHHTPVDDNAFEFLEIYNAEADPVNLSGFTIFGVTFTFPAGSFIAPGEYIVVADTPANYAGQGYQVFDFNGGLSDSGETITIFDTFNQAADSVTYGVIAPWPTTTNGTNFSLSLLDPTLDNVDPANWAASRETGGTPGAENFPPLPVPPIVINEIHYNPTITPTVGIEFIELVNDGPDPVALDGFTLSGVDYTFPTGTTLAAGGYLVVAADATGQPTWLQWTSGDLADDGETLTLLDSRGQTVDSVTYADTGGWPTAPDGGGPSLSLLDPALDNADPANWAASDLVGGTPGATNFPALPVVINEIHYNPTITPTVGIEFIELVNDGPDPVALDGFTLSGVDYTFPTGTTLAAGGYLVVAADATGQPTWLQWTSGDLADDGETLTLLDSRGQTVDSVTYADTGGWPTAPDGGGSSLSLLDPALDNADPANWTASDLVGGTPGAANNIP